MYNLYTAYRYYDICMLYYTESACTSLSKVLAHCFAPRNSVAMSSIGKAVKGMNFTSMQMPEILGFGQKIFGMMGKSEMAALPRWGIVGGLTAYWFVEPDFSRWNPEPEADAPPAE